MGNVGFAFSGICPFRSRTMRSIAAVVLLLAKVAQAQVMPPATQFSKASFVPAQFGSYRPAMRNSVAANLFGGKKDQPAKKGARGKGKEEEEEGNLWDKFWEFWSPGQTGRLEVSNEVKKLTGRTERDENPTLLEDAPVSYMTYFAVSLFGLFAGSGATFAKMSRSRRGPLMVA